jgi:long-chain acyl-CoA synthetase
VNTLFNALLNTPGFDRLDFSALKVSLGGGMAVQRAVAERWKQVTGNTLTQAWGLTETSPGACINPLDAPEFNGSIGLPISSTVITIRDDDGNVLPVRQSGEICVEGPQVMRGYWNRPGRDREGDDRRGASCAPATSATWTRTATCSSRTARRT